ncbi:MAG TPA: S41 family peptidase [Alphaproteobacteria bacterium]|nr:S41 family peptidase [Alphaproteobacteria bacterium]
MSAARSGWRRSAAVCASAALALLAAACAGPTRSPIAFDRDRGGQVLDVAFQNIRDKYIDPVPMSTVAEDALHRLSDIDPALAVEADGTSLTLSDDGRTLAQAPLPDDDDAEGWAEVAANFVVAAETKSKALAEAPAETVYSELMRGALKPLDPLSRYADARRAARQRAAREGYGGIGVQIAMTPRGAVISSVSADTPAAGAALRAGDVILRIDGDDVRRMDDQEAAQRLRGRVGSVVRLGVAPTGAAGPTDVLLRRTLIVPDTVRLDMVGDIALIRITSFNHGTAVSLARAIRDARHESRDRLKGIILDLRGNPGGLLDQAVAVADVFLESGRIVSARGRHPDSFQLFDATGPDIAHGAPLVILVDGGSASSSEIVTAALQDRGRAVVVGSNSYGKGSVQNIVRLPNDGELALTWARLYAPSGYSFDGLGILPNVCTSQSQASGDTVLARIARGEITNALRLAAWRTADALDNAQRQALERTCPKVRGDRAVDLEVAEGLLKNQKLYARALSLAVQTDEAP